MDEIMKKYPNDVKFVLKNGPRGTLNESNTKYTAALYAVAAGQQGKYFEMSHKMFEKNNNSKLKKDPKFAIQLAKELGLDTEQLISDYQSAKVRSLVAEEKQQFSNLGKQGMARLGVPKFLINGKEPQGRRSVAAWSTIIDAELKK
tara:strand:+ start:559 stop:996 length:438 start_codon:yes stop_codon:yes gene_type:complete